MPAEGTTHERVELPEGAIVTCEIEVVGYLHPDTGETLYGTRYKAETTTAAVLGLMEMAKHDLLVRRDEEEEA
jgi:hypothetical protein